MTKFFFLAFIALSVSQVAQAACEESTTNAQITQAAQAGERAFGEGNIADLLWQASQARSEILPCVDEVLTPQALASFNRLMGLEAFFNNNRDRTVAEFHAALKLEPGYQFPEDIFSPGNPVLKMYESARLVDDGEAEPVYPPNGGYVMVGGVRNAARYAKTPVVIQVYGLSGAWIETRYVQPGEALPRWSDNPFGLTAEDIGLRRPKLTNPRPWYGVGVVAVVLSGVFYAASVNQNNQFLDTSQLDDPDSTDDLMVYADRSRGFGVAAFAIGGAALAFTGTGIGMQVKFGGPKGDRAPKFTPTPNP